MTPRFDGPGDASTRGGRSNGFARAGHVPADLVAAYADQELDPGSALWVERHVGECPRCQDSLRLQRTVRDRLRQEPAPGVPFALRDRIFAAVSAAPRPEAGTARGRARSRWRPRALVAGLARNPAWAVAAVLVLAVLASPWDRLRPGSDRVSPDGAGAGVAGSSDSAAILQLILHHAAAWNNRDAKAAVAMLTGDAVWVTSTGVELRGREEIERAHTQWLAQDSAAGGTVHIHPPGSITVRFLQPDVAVADLEGQFALPAAAGEPPVVVEQARIFVVATRTDEGWRIAQLRNMRRQVGSTLR
jgi:uncharacterized protein (TIGR02246 family)